MSGQDILQEPRQAVFRVTENGESMYFSVPESVELLQAAAHLRDYLSDENAGTKFTAIFPHGEKITQEQFGAAAAERMENTGRIAGASTRRRFLRSTSWTVGRSTQCKT